MDVSTISHDLPFDPTYGYDLEALRSVGPPPEPSDFAPFWQATYAANEAIPLRLREGDSEQQVPGATTRLLRFDTLGYADVGAWLVIPEDADTRTVVIAGHGYGGRGGPDAQRICRQRSPWLYPVAPGFHISARDDFRFQGGYEHVTVGIAHRESYIIRACVAMFWSAARIVRERWPEAQICYTGGSFSGGLGALMLPWEPAFARAVLDVPTFGHHPIRLQCTCHGSGQGVIDHVARHPEVAEEVLPYYDAATAATHIRIPVLATPARFDPAVPPPGQFAVANAIRGEGSERVERHIGHFELPAVGVPDQLRHAKAVRRFLGE